MVRERLRGGPPAATWDVWSLALVAFEALTGAHPFPGPDLASRRRAILEGRRLACGQALQGAAAGWEGFFSKALHTDPACRFASAAGFGDGLARACGDLPGGETPPRRES
jgi:serine/threonine-protein kinase